MNLRINPNDALKKMSTEIERRAFAIEVLGRSEAARMENEAKATHPWTNRTGEAERRIVGRVERRGDMTRISLSHGVRYGVYLELANEKRYAVLWPTIRRHAPEILNAVAKIGGGK
jgi:hypothetical protein